MSKLKRANFIKAYKKRRNNSFCNKTNLNFIVTNKAYHLKNDKMINYLQIKSKEIYSGGKINKIILYHLNSRAIPTNAIGVFYNNKWYETKILKKSENYIHKLMYILTALKKQKT